LCPSTCARTRLRSAGHPGDPTGLLGEHLHLRGHHFGLSDFLNKFVQHLL
jgi:hypothetical protein